MKGLQVWEDLKYFVSRSPRSFSCSRWRPSLQHYHWRSWVLLRFNSAVQSRHGDLDGLPATISRTLHSPISLVGRKGTALGFPSGLQSKKCMDRAENLSSVPAKLSIYDANVQRVAYPALISASANAANDSFCNTHNTQRQSYNTHVIGLGGMCCKQTKKGSLEQLSFVKCV